MSEYKGIQYLKNKLISKQARVELRYKYYTSKVADSMKELSLATVGSIDTNLIPSSVGTDFEMHSYTENEAIIDYDRLANAVAVALERAGFVISVDGRVFGRLVRSVI